MGFYCSLNIRLLPWKSECVNQACRVAFKNIWGLLHFYVHCFYFWRPFLGDCLDIVIFFFTEYQKFINTKSTVQNTNKAIVMKAFQHLEMLELVLPLSKSLGNVQYEFRLMQLLLDTSQMQDVIHKASTLPTDISQWAISVMSNRPYWSVLFVHHFISILETMLVLWTHYWQDVKSTTLNGSPVGNSFLKCKVRHVV